MVNIYLPDVEQTHTHSHIHISHFYYVKYQSKNETRLLSFQSGGKIRSNMFYVLY